MLLINAALKRLEQNIFIVNPGPFWYVKIDDFGICKSTITRQTSLHTLVGTSGYQAPEVIGLLAPSAATETHYDAKCDVWSLGCLIFEVLTSNVPFPAIASLGAYCSDRSLFPWQRLYDFGASQQAYDFLNTLLRPQPQARPTADQVGDLGAPWFHSTFKPPVPSKSLLDPTALPFEDCHAVHFPMADGNALAQVEQLFTNDQQPRVNDVLYYLDQVKDRFGDQHSVYNRFLNIIKDSKSPAPDTLDVIKRVVELFGNHPVLVRRFDIFLPDGYRVTCGIGGYWYVTYNTPNGASRGWVFYGG